jgi:hypothetical protein
MAWTVIVCGALIHIAGFALYQFPDHKRLPAEPGRLVIEHYVAANGLQERLIQGEYASLFDSAPLYLPTGRTFAATIDSVASLRQESELFTPFPHALSSQLFKPSTFLGARSGHAADDNFIVTGGLPWRPLGKAPMNLSEANAVASLPSFTVVDLASAKTVGHGMFEVPDSVIPAELWNPLRFYIAVESFSIIGVPRMAASSGNASLDEAVLVQLHSFAPLQHLAPGYYELVIFP